MATHKKKFHSKHVGDVQMTCFFCGKLLANVDCCEKMKQKIHAVATLKAFNDAFKLDKHREWAEPAQEYEIPRLFFNQESMELWWTPGAVDQSNSVNNLRDIKHPDQKEFPPVTGKKAKMNRLTHVSKNQINITNERFNLTVQSYSCDLCEKETKDIQKRNKVLGRTWVFGLQSTYGLHKRARDAFNEEFQGDAENGWKEGQPDDITIEIDRKQHTLAAAGYMIVLATHKVTGKHICLCFLWPCFNVPETDPTLVFCFANSVDYWFALVLTHSRD